MNQNEAYQVNHGYVKCPHCDLYIHQIVDKARESESKSCQEALKQMNEAYNEDLKLSRLTLIREIKEAVDESKLTNGHFDYQFRNGYNHALTEVLSLLLKLEK